MASQSFAPAQKRRLVIVRAGDDSLHRNWLSGAEPPSFDLAVSYYGDDPSAFSDAAIRHAAKGGKWDGLYAFLVVNPEVFERYDWIWLPDDDLDATASSINRLFDIVESYRLDVAQPSLSWESHYAHFVTLQNPACRLRFTNFVETMAPIFRTAFLKQNYLAFAQTRYGWPLEFLWPRWMADPLFKTAIVDVTCVRHTKPVGKGSLNTGSAQGPAEENDRIRSKYGLRRPRIATYAAVTHDDRRIVRRWRLIGLLFRGWKPFLRSQFAHPGSFRPEGPLTGRRLLRLVVKTALHRFDLRPIAFRPEFHQSR